MDIREHIKIIYGYWLGQIAFSQQEVDDMTKVYIGSLFPGIFHDYPQLEHIYTSFPDGKIQRTKDEVKSGLISGTDLEKLLLDVGYEYSNNEHEMLQSGELNIPRNSQCVQIIGLRVRDLGFSDEVKVYNFFDQAFRVGLKLCPGDMAPLLMLNKFREEYDCSIAMKPIIIPSGQYYEYHNIFHIRSSKVCKPTLYSHDINGKKCRSDEQWIFQL